MIIRQIQIKRLIYIYMIINIVKAPTLSHMLLGMMLSILCVFDMQYMEVPKVAIYISCFLIYGLQTDVLAGWIMYMGFQLLNILFKEDIIGQGDIDVFMIVVWVVGLYESCKIILFSCILAYIYSKIKHTQRFAFIPFIYMSYILWRL